MPTPAVHSAEFSEGYRLTAVGDSLFIEATEDHPHPLRLRSAQLASFGLHLEHGSRVHRGDGGQRAELIPASQLRFGLLILVVALAILLLVPAVLSGW